MGLMKNNYNFKTIESKRFSDILNYHRRIYVYDMKSRGCTFEEICQRIERSRSRASELYQKSSKENRLLEQTQEDLLGIDPKTKDHFLFVGLLRKKLT